MCGQLSTFDTSHFAYESFFFFAKYWQFFSRLARNTRQTSRSNERLPPGRFVAGCTRFYALETALLFPVSLQISPIRPVITLAPSDAIPINFDLYAEHNSSKALTVKSKILTALCFRTWLQQRYVGYDLKTARWVDESNAIENARTSGDRRILCGNNNFGLVRNHCV